MAMHAGEIAKLAHIDLENFRVAPTKRDRLFGQLVGKTVHPKLTATIAVTAFVSLLRADFFSDEIFRRPEAGNAGPRNRT